MAAGETNIPGKPEGMRVLQIAQKQLKQSTKLPKGFFITQEGSLLEEGLLLMVCVKKFL